MKEKEEKMPSTEVDVEKSYIKAVEKKVERVKEAVLSQAKNIDTENDAEKKLSLRHRAVCQMAAIGFTPVQIAEQIGLSKERVSLILRSTTGRREVEKLQNELFFKDPKRMFLAEVPKAFKKVKKILHSKEARDSEVLKAADMIFDRAMGKPTQEIQHEGSAIRQLFEALDKASNPEVKKVESVVIDAEFKEVKKEEQKDEIDQWLDENL